MAFFLVFTSDTKTNYFIFGCHSFLYTNIHGQTVLIFSVSLLGVDYVWLQVCVKFIKLVTVMH